MIVPLHVPSLSESCSSVPKHVSDRSGGISPPLFGLWGSCWFVLYADDRLDLDWRSGHHTGPSRTTKSLSGCQGARGGEWVRRPWLKWWEAC
jgi:hypothetical protein